MEKKLEVLKYQVGLLCRKKLTYESIRTINVPLILKVQDIIFFSRAKHIMGHFLGFFEAQGNLGLKKVSAPSKTPRNAPLYMFGLRPKK